MCLTRERGCGEDCPAVLAELGARWPAGPHLVVWDNAPPHHTRVVRATAEACHVEVACLPFRSPELNPCEDLWRRLKATVAANRCYPHVDELGQCGLAWLTSLTNEDVLRLTGFHSSKFAWLPA